MKNKKFVATAVSAALVASVVAPVVAGAATGEATTKTNIVDVKLYSSTKAKVYYKTTKGTTTYKNVDLSAEPVRHLATYALIPWGGKTVKWNFSKRVQLPQQKSFAKYLAEGQEAVKVADQGAAKTAAGLAAAHFKNMNRLDYSPNSYKMYQEKLAALQADVAAMASKVKAVNSTTVEVTMDAVVNDVTALKFAIDGLDIKNAAVKQTDNKTVVLTTSAQEGGKTYTVKESGTVLGSFQGVSSVIPTAVKMDTPTLQGTLGNEVTVKASVTVPEGQSKAGIPVTFNINNINKATNNATGSNQYAGTNNKNIEVTVLTDENGVASYSYTRYYSGADDVVAYASERANVFARGNVYWAQGITITEVTTGNKLANQAKKIYKIKTDVWNVLPGAATTANGGYVNLAFAENVNVTADKVVRGVTVTDTRYTGSNALYPYQLLDNDQEQVVRIAVDKNGEGTFTLTGSNATVTPIVFVDNTGGNDREVDRLSPTELQAAAPAVTFEVQQTVELAVTAAGETNASADKSIGATAGQGQGGREYTATVKDKNGVIAPKGTRVYLVFPDKSFSTDKDVYAWNGHGSTKTQLSTTKVAKDVLYPMTVGDNGQVKFTLTGQNGAFAQPTVFIDNGSTAGKLDTADLQTVAPMTYFVDAVVKTAKLKITDANGKETGSFKVGELATFTYSSTDQNGFDYYAGNGDYLVSFQVKAQFGDVTVKANGKTYQVPFGQTVTVPVTASAGKASIQVTASLGGTAVVDASASVVSLPNVTATATFSNSQIITSSYNGWVKTLYTLDNELEFDGKDTIKYAGETGKTYKYMNGSVELTKTQFEDIMRNATGIYVSYSVDGDAKTFNITSTTGTLKVNVTTSKAPVAAPVINLTNLTKTYAVGATLDLNTGVDITDTNGTKIPATSATKTITLKGSTTPVAEAEVTKKVGTYVVTYTVVSPVTGATATNTAEITVTADGTVAELTGTITPVGYANRVVVVLPTGTTAVDAVTANGTAVAAADYTITASGLVIFDATKSITSTSNVKVVIGTKEYTVKF